MTEQRKILIDSALLTPGADMSSALDSEASLLLIAISREEIETKNWAGGRELLSGLAGSKKRVGRWRGGVEIVITGYDEDRRELYEIAEVRKFISRIDEVWPFAFHYLSREGTFLWTLLYTQCAAQVVSYERNAEGRIPFNISVDGVAEFFTAHFRGLKELRDKYSLTNEEIGRTAREVVNFYDIDATWKSLLEAAAVPSLHAVFPDTFR